MLHNRDQGSSATCIRIRVGDPVERIMKILKKKQDREGIVKALKARRFYLKPSVKRREKEKAAKKTRKTRLRPAMF